MRVLKGDDFDPYRIPAPAGMILANPGVPPMGNENTGLFVFPSPTAPNTPLRCIAASGGGWDHISVSTPIRAPIWAEMDWVKRRFFKPTEVVMQLHVEDKNHINIHPHVLHLWRPHKGVIPLPPKIYV